jgi:hypothetical protein
LTSIELRSVSGQLLKNETVNSTAFDFSLTGLPGGLYLLRLQTKEGDWAVKKVVKVE